MRAEIKFDLIIEELLLLRIEEEEVCCVEATTTDFTDKMACILEFSSLLLKESSSVSVVHGQTCERYGDTERLGLRFFFGPMKNEEKGAFFLAKSRFANCQYFLKKARNGKLCKHNREGNFL